MATERIVNLSDIGTVADDDTFAIVDDTDTTTKKVSASVLQGYLANLNLDAFFAKTFYMETDTIPNKLITVYVAFVTSFDIKFNPFAGVPLGIQNGGDFTNDLDRLKFFLLIADRSFNVTVTDGTYSDGTTSKPLTQYDHIFLYIDIPTTKAWILDYKHTP